MKYVTFPVLTWGDSCGVTKIRIHLVLARCLSSALLWRTVDSAAYAQRNQ